MFPSPIGELHFSIELLESGAIAVYRFRPLSGSYISQSEEKQHEIRHIGFRPLSGSYISQFFVILLKMSIVVSVPYRGATFLNPKERRVGYEFRQHSVSVPYRGATFLNLVMRDVLEKIKKVVSVPYRGATFLNRFM